MSPERSRLDGRVALVTGAARGQGQAHAVRFAQAGADVIALDVGAPGGSAASLEETVQLVEAVGRRIVARAVDVRDGAALDAAVDEGVAALGRLDAAVANAGVLRAGGCLEVSEEDWRLSLDINLTGAWLTCRAAVRHMVAAERGGAIVIVGSTEAIRSSGGAVAYTTSKHGTVGLMHALAVELGDRGIRVNAVHPTIVRTPMLEEFAPPGLDEEGRRAHFRQMHALPVGWVEPEDVSDAVLFLASDAARFITGVDVPVDAGALALRRNPS
ncbi:MAG TPA: mycofactocin-coupled SDR family oxidoreductase [Conexibacter sp.]|nr:mycofactocin-coupled SDR family oxidoreductase [Conexibacter sp.]